MTALILHVKRQAVRTIHSPRRLNVLLVLMLLVALAGVALAIQATPQTVTYNSGSIPVIAPIEAEVCLGGTVHFPLTTTVKTDQIPGRLEIDESWCMEGLGGPCKSAVAPNPRIPMLELKHIVAERTARTMPNTVTPGVWHFWHTATDNRGNVAGYIVAPIYIKDCTK